MQHGKIIAVVACFLTFRSARILTVAMYYEQYPMVTWFVVPSYLLVIVVGTFGNLVVLHAYVTGERIWEKPYNLILSHGVVADLIICAFFTPLLVLYRSNAPSRVIEITPLCEMSVFSSMLAISLQYVIFPLFALNRRDLVLNRATPFLTLPKCKKILTVGWLMCVVASGILVSLLRNELVDEATPRLYRCILVNRKLDAFTIFFLGYSTLLYCASTLIAYRCYKDIRNAGTVDDVISIDDTRRTKMCMIVAVVYTVFWTPFLMVQLTGLFSEYSELLFNLHAVSSVFGVLASAVNPFLYSHMDHYYKKKFINIFKFTASND